MSSEKSLAPRSVDSTEPTDRLVDPHSSPRTRHRACEPTDVYTERFDESHQRRRVGTTDRRARVDDADETLKRRSSSLERARARGIR